jgi:hypothetical protein
MESLNGLKREGIFYGEGGVFDWEGEAQRQDQFFGSILGKRQDRFVSLSRDHGRFSEYSNTQKQCWENEGYVNDKALLLFDNDSKHKSFEVYEFYQE